MITPAMQAASKFLKGLDELPTLSTSAQSVLSALHQPDVSFKQVSNLLERDPALSARILKATNSALYPTLQKVSNLQLAISRLGVAEVGQLVMASALLDTFSGPRDGMDWMGFWKHSFSSGIASQLVSVPGLVDDEAGHTNLGENPYFVAGLVHHLGILVEHLRDPERFDRARELASRRGGSLSEGELEIFGFTHAETGAALLEQWHLPEDVVHAALAHHDPDGYSGSHRRTVDAVHLSAMLCHDLNQADPFEGVEPWFSEAAFYGLGWSLDRIPVLKRRVRQALERGSALGNAMLGEQP